MKQNGNGQSPSRLGKTGHESQAPWQIIWVPVEQIGPSPFQPRVIFDLLEMQELIESVKNRNVQQPTIIRTTKPKPTQDEKAASNGKARLNGQTNAPSPLPYELVAGERRLRACKAAKKKFIPAIVRDDLSDAEAAELALLENVQRSNLSVIEEARGYKRLMLEFRLKEERLSKKVGKSVSTIREMLKLLQLPESVQALLFERKLTATHGHALLPLAPFEKACIAVARYVAREKLTAVSLETTPLPNPKELKSLETLHPNHVCKPRTHTKRRPSHIYTLQGLLSCAYCGHPMSPHYVFHKAGYGRRHDSYTCHYVCSMHKKYGKDCDHRNRILARSAES